MCIYESSRYCTRATPRRMPSSTIHCPYCETFISSSPSSISFWPKLSARKVVTPSSSERQRKACRTERVQDLFPVLLDVALHPAHHEPESGVDCRQRHDRRKEHQVAVGVQHDVERVVERQRRGPGHQHQPPSGLYRERTGRRNILTSRTIYFSWRAIIMNFGF